MTQLLASVPWWLTIMFILGGAITLFYGNQTLDSRTRTTGLLIVSLAILLGAARFLIDTPAEAAERRTRLIVDSCSNHDWTKLAALLDADTQLDVSGKEKELNVANMKFRGSDEITRDAQAASDAAKLKTVSIWQLKTQTVDNTISVAFTAYSVQDSTGGQPIPSGWEFDYVPVPGSSHWDLKTIKLTSLGNESLQ